MSSESFTRGGHPVVTAVEVVSAALDQTGDADMWALSDDDLSAVLTELEVLAARQAELSLRVVREADARDLGRRMGAPSTAAWLRHGLRLRPGDARTRVTLANRFEPPADGPADWAANVSSRSGSWSMPATAEALARGACSVDHAGVVARTMASLPASLCAEQLQVAEQQLAGWAEAFDPGEVANLGRSLIHLLDADTLEECEQRAYERRSLALIDRGDGSTRISGQLDNESAEIVRAALDPLAAPASASDGERDRRTSGQRMADALVELARRALDEGHTAPAGHAVRPHVSVLIGFDALLAKAGESGVAPGELAFGGPISAAAVRRISCHAGISRVITDPAGVPLDVGREHRLVTAGQWTALVARDGGCAFPGCTRPSSWCIAHHRVHWADGGLTDLDNLVLLCDYHHRVVHHDGWDVILGDDALPAFVPPAWIDPTRTPQRNTRPRYTRGP
jgi:Domain of unknown function (DUF222)